MKKILFSLVFILLYSSLHAGAKEDVIKGVILERISQFISYENVNENFIICVYGNKNLAKSFKSLYDNRTYKDKPIEIALIDSTQEMKDCNVLYVKNLDKRIMNKIISKKQKDTLLVTEEIDYIYDGFMIALYFESNKLRFAINKTAMTDANLNVNYRLLKVASKVIGGNK